LTAPALAPLIASISQFGSSSSRSRTPQVNAPNEQPPCNARDSRRGGQQVRLWAKRRFCQVLFCQRLPILELSVDSAPYRRFSGAICSAGLLRCADASIPVDQISAADGSAAAAI